MPKETFLNLPDAKREVFVEAALREFAARDYQAASITHIVATLGIAKGSVYQYFEDKAELYAWLLGLASERKFSWIREALRAVPPPGDFFAFHRDLILAGAAFDLAHPLYSLLLANGMREAPASVPGRLASVERRRTLEFLLGYIREAQDSGEVRTDVDEVLLAGFVNAASLSIAAYLEEKHGFSLLDRLSRPDLPLPCGEAEIEAAVDSLVDLLWRGLRPPA